MYIKQAKKEDCIKVSEMLYSSGSELYDFLFQTKTKHAMEFIRYEFMSGKGLCGYNNVIGLYENNGILGTSCFYSQDNYSIISYQTLSNVIKYYSFIDIIPMLFRLLKIESIMKKPKKGEIYLSNFAIDSASRNKGYGSYLINEALKKYKELGFQKMGLDVDLSNENARKLYVKMGFLEKEKKHMITKRSITVEKIEIIKMEKIL
jgi:ribosomal protein S18 acetylase RimI-like enzyme